MDDGTKLLVAQRRLLNLCRSKSLLDLSTQKIVQNIKWFIKDSDHQEKLTKLPSLLKKKLLEKVTCQKFVHIDDEEKDMFSRFNAFELLLCPQIKEIKIKGLMAVGPGRFDKILEIITTRAPNLISLTIVQPERSYKDFPKPYEYPVSIKEIGKLGKLRKLVLRSSMVDYMQVKEMCRNELRNLRYLDFSLNFDSETSFEDVEDFKESFGNLQYFLFDSYSRDASFSPRKYGKMLWKMCIKHLPNLIGVETIEKDELQFGIEDRYITEVPSEVSALRYLSVMPFIIEIHRAFPHINHLKIYFDGDERDLKINTLLQFQNIKSLFLLNVKSLETVNKFIRCYGPKLETLYLSVSKHYDIRLKFKSLFKSCPRLETLAMNNVDVVDDGEPLKFFSKLKELIWYPRWGRKLCLSNVIQAPDLQVVEFQFESFNVDDLRKVSDLIAKKTILTKLQSLCAINYNIICMKNPMENQDFVASFNVLSAMMKNASAFLPDLIDIDLDLRVDFKNFDLNGQPLDCDCRFISKDFAATIRILDSNLIDFLIPTNKYFYVN